MEFSGYSYREIGSTKQLSFSASGIFIDNATGSGCIGFAGTWSGESREVDFSFVSGKIIDPQNRYVYSYLENKNFNLSGNIYDDNYEYYIDDTPVCFGGTKEKNVIDKVYVSANNCIITTDLYIAADAPSYEFTQGDSFSKGGVYNINITNNNQNLPFTILNGTLLNENFLITNLPLRVTGSENIIVSGSSDLATGNYSETLSLNTSAGDMSHIFGVEVIS